MGNSSRADELIKKYGLDAPQNTTSTRAQQLINQYGLDATPASQRAAATAARPTTPQMWEPTIEDYNEGAAAYVEKKQQQEEAKRGMFSAGLDILGTAALQAQRAVNGVYADQQQTAEETQRALEAYGRFAEAKDQFDEARAPVQWQGREEAVDEYKKAENNYVSKLIRSALIFNPGNDLAEQREKLNDQREKIEVRDIAAGNGPRALTGLDRADQVIGGTAKGIGADLSMTFGEFYRLYGNYPFNAPMGEFLRGENRKVWEEQQEQLKTRWKRVEDFAKTLSVDASASLETAKNGLGITGQAGVDMAQNAIEMTFDHFAGMAVGSPLVVMFARVYGQADMEAQEQGVDVDTAAAYGLSKAAIEVATEKMFDLVGIYGGNGMGDEWVEDLVYKLADDSVGQWFLRTLLNASGEGAEEVVSSLMDPITQMILDPSLTLDSYGERLDTADAAYSAIIGATLGLFSAAHVGQHRAANAALEVRRNMAEELRSRGYSDNLSEQVAPTLAKAVMGEELTEAEQAELQRWPTAQEVLQDVETSRELQTILENAQQAEPEEPAGEDNNVPTTETAQPQRATMTAEDYARRVIDAEPETADTSTEEGRARLQSATANLGGYSDAAVQAYESGQDVGNYAAGMYEAAAIYAAAGADVKAAVQQARDGKIRSAMRVLTDNQVAIAEDIGRQMREDSTKAANDVSAAYSVIRQQAAAIGTRAAQNTARISAAVRRANSIGSTAMVTFKAQRDALEAMVQANPELEGSEEFNRLFDEAKRNMETVQRMQRAVENLKNKRAKAEEEQRRATEHKAGRVSYETKSGSVGGVQYEAVDRSKLTQTQQAVTRIAEAIAKATGLEIHVARFGGKIGGEYQRGQGGVIWLNIDANYKGANISVGSLTHELTHWLQKYAPEEYQQLKRVVLDEMTRDPARFAKIFGERARIQPDLRPSDITDEMTANACQILFMDEASVQRIVSENRNLGQKILDFFKSILADIKAAFSEIDTSSDFTLYQEVRAAEGAIDQMRDLFVQAMHTATENLQAERTVQQENVRLSEKNARNATAEQEERTAGLDTREQTKVQFQRYVQDEETAQFLKEQEDEGKVIHTYKSFLEIDGKLYPPMASKEKGADGTYRMRNAIEPGRWVESEGNLKNIIIDPKNGRGYFNLKKDDGSTIKAAYNPYQHSSNLMLNDQFTGAYSRPNLVTYECIIPEIELTSGYRAEYAKDAVGLHPWKSGPVAGKLAKAKGTERQVYLSRWLKPIRKVPEAEVAQHYKELLDGTDIGVPSNVVPPSLLRALEDAGVKIEYDERAPKQSEQMTGKNGKASNSAVSEAVSDTESAEESSKTTTQAQFQMLDSVEETDRLVAVHNKSVSGLKRMLARGGVPFPSIAIKKAGAAHEGFGDVSIVFPRSTIDPAESRWNRLYSNDAWTPTEPRTEYEADEKITTKIKKAVEKLVGSAAYNALNGSSYLHSSQIERALLDSNGDVFNAFKSLSVVKYAYLKSKGQDVDLPTREKPLDGSYSYKNSELKAVFDEIDGERLATAQWDDTELAEEIASVLNRRYEQQLQNSTSQNKDKLLAAIRKTPLYRADNINLGTIRYAYETYQRDGWKFITETDSHELDRMLRNNTAVESDPEYRAWIEQTFQGIIKNEGIPNGKDLYTDSGNMRSFKARHVPATLENIVQQMRKENERGNGLFGVNLRGAATKAYSSVEEMRQDAGKLLGTHVSDDVYDGIMEGFHNRLHEMASAATKYPDRMSSYDTARDVLLETVRDAKSKAAMNRMLQKERDYIKYTPELADKLWTLRNDVQNMPAPYFEAKPRRIVYPEEALAYILPDNADSSVIKALENKGYNVLTYKAGDEQDRLAKLNSVEGAQFQRWDDTTDDTEEEKAGREMAYARIQSENAVLTETVNALRKLTAKQDNTIEKLQKRLQLTKTPEVRETDARNLARQLLAEHGSRADLVEVAAQIKALGDYLLQTNTQDVSEDELKNRARQIAAGIIDAATENINLDSERYQQIAGDIKGKKLSIDEDFLGELDAAGGYEKFRKSLFGSLTLAKRDSNTAETREDYTSVSQFYADLQSTYGKGSFPDVANEGEEVQILAQMLEAGKPTEVNPYEKYRGEATEELSNRIVMDALNGVLRATPPTDADRQKSRRVALQQQIKALKAENKLSEREAGRLYATIYDLSVALDKAESRYTTLRKEADIRAAKVYQEGLARAAEIKARERAKAAEQIKDLKEHYKEMQRNARERRENTASRNKIRRLIDRLNDRLKHPTANKYVPKELVQLTIDTLNLIDIDTGTGSKTMAEKLADIRTTYAKYQADEKYSVVYDPVTAQMLDNLEQEIRGTKLKDMNEKQLNMVYETLKSLLYVVDKAVNVRIGSEERNAFELSKEMTDETRAVPKAQTGWIREHAIPAHLRADVAFDRFGGFKKNSAWTQVARLLNDGQLKQTRLRMELSIPFAELFNNQKALADYTGVNAFGKIDSKKLVDVGLKDADGNAIPVTRDFMVALYLDLLNEGNRLHFIRGGKTVPDFQKYYDGKDAYGAGSRRAVGISEELSALYRERNEAERANYGDWSDDVKARIEALESEGEKYANQVKQTIERLMTDYDRAWVKAIQQLMDVDSKRELNQTTMDVYGIEKAQVPNYFPLFSDKDFIASDMETVSQNISLENAGFMKERVKSGNPTRAVGSVWAVKTQIDRVAQYCGLMPAIRSFNKIYNKTQSGYADSLKKALGQQFGKSGTDYVENLIADLSGGRAERTDEFGISRAIGRLRGNLARSSLTFNPRVALGQAASYPTAAAELGYKALGKALAHGGRNGHIVSRADKELIAKWSPLLWYRMQGYSTPELGDIQGSNRFGDRVWRKFRYVTGWIQAVDGATVGRLWYAAEYWVQDNKPNLEKGSDAYYEAVAEKFNAVVEKTQPNYTTMQRAAILRNPDSLIKTLTMFMTQRLQNFNILYDAAGRYQKARADFAANGRNGVTQADVNEARTDMTRAVTSQIAQAALFVGMKMFVDFLLHSVKKYRDKETGDLTVESVSLSALDAFCDTLLGNAVFGSELYGVGKAMVGAGKWYGISISGVDTVGDLIESIVNLRNANVKWEDASSRKAFYNRVLKVGTNGAQAAGYPLNNAVKMGQAVYYHIKDAANGHFLSYESDANRTNAQKAEKWIRALEGGDEAAAEYAKSLFDDEKKAISALKDALKDSVADGERTAADASEMLVKAGMTKNDAFFLTQGWETGDSGKYTAVKRAALAGDTAAFRQAMSDLTTHGVKRETAQSEIKKFIRALYMGKDLGEEEREIVGDKKLTSAQARKLLHDYGDLSVDDAVSTVNSWDEVLQFNRKHGTDYETYGLTINQARYYYDNDTVKSSLRFADYASQVDKYGLDAVKEYYGDEDWKATGLTMAEYADYTEKAAKCKGTDKNGDGKVDRYSKKNQMVELITSLPVSIEVKDAIYLKNGWSASQVRSMPWH